MSPERKDKIVKTRNESKKSNFMTELRVSRLLEFVRARHSLLFQVT